jgi:hypothetical protein
MIVGWPLPEVRAESDVGKLVMCGSDCGGSVSMRYSRRPMLGSCPFRRVSIVTNLP